MLSRPITRLVYVRRLIGGKRLDRRRRRVRWASIRRCIKSGGGREIARVLGRRALGGAGVGDGRTMRGNEDEEGRRSAGDIWYGWSWTDGYWCGRGASVSGALVYNMYSSSSSSSENSSLISARLSTTTTTRLTNDDSNNKRCVVCFRTTTQHLTIPCYLLSAPLIEKKD